MFHARLLKNKPVTCKCEVLKETYKYFVSFIWGERSPLSIVTVLVQLQKSSEMWGHHIIYLIKHSDMCK